MQINQNHLLIQTATVSIQKKVADLIEIVEIEAANRNEKNFLA